MPAYIENNLDIVLATGAIIVAIFLYALLKKRIRHNTRDDLVTIEPTGVVEDMYDDPSTTQKEHLNFEEASKKKQNNNDALEQTTNSKNPDTNIRTNTVPSHGKITKEDFKRFAGLKILVAEDNIINQKVISGLLGDSGIEVVFANDGMEAVNLVQNQGDFDLILMDAHMPNMDGFSATQKIRSQHAFDTLPVVALTGDVASDDIKKMYDAGMDAHLEKPLRIDALYDVLYAFTKVPRSDDDALDTQRGLEISGGDEAFYTEILHAFRTNYASMPQHLKTWFSADDTKRLESALVDITGTAANIGATPLAEEAKRLRQSIATQGKIDADSFESFLRSFQTLLSTIERYINAR